MFRKPKWIAGIIMLALFFSSNVLALQDKKPVAESVDKRFAKFANGTILDRKTDLLWIFSRYFFYNIL